MELSVIRKILQKEVSSFQSFVAKAEESERYYNNQNDILVRGAGAIDAVNNYLTNLGENPLKSADNRIPLNWHKILLDQK